MDNINIITFIEKNIKNIEKFGIARDDYIKLREHISELDINPNMFTKFKSNNFVDEVIKTLRSRIEVEKTLKMDDAIKDIVDIFKQFKKLKTIIIDLDDFKDIDPVFTLKNYKKVDILKLPFNELVSDHLELLTTDIDIQYRLKEIQDYTEDEKIKFETLNDLFKLYKYLKDDELPTIENSIINALTSEDLNFSINDYLKQILKDVDKPSFYPTLKTIEKIINTL